MAGFGFAPEWASYSTGDASGSDTEGPATPAKVKQSSPMRKRPTTPLQVHKPKPPPAPVPKEQNMEDVLADFGVATDDEDDPLNVIRQEPKQDARNIIRQEAEKPKLVQGEGLKFKITKEPPAAPLPPPPQQEIKKPVATDNKGEEKKKKKVEEPVQMEQDVKEPEPKHSPKKPKKKAVAPKGVGKEKLLKDRVPHTKKKREKSHHVGLNGPALRRLHHRSQNSAQTRALRISFTPDPECDNKTASQICTEALKAFLAPVLFRAFTITRHCKRNTMSRADVDYALDLTHRTKLLGNASERGFAMLPVQRELEDKAAAEGRELTAEENQRIAKAVDADDLEYDPLYVPSKHHEDDEAVEEKEAMDTAPDSQAKNQQQPT